MDRDWEAEKARVEREYAEAMAAMDIAYAAVQPGSSDKRADPADLAIYNGTKDRFEESKAYRSVFYDEHEAYMATRGCGPH